jgi:hypothetical protein
MVLKRWLSASQNDRKELLPNTGRTSGSNAALGFAGAARFKLPPHLKNDSFSVISAKKQRKNGSSFLLLPSKVFQKF